MADSETITPTNLFVAFWHDDKIEASAITADPDAALRSRCRAGDSGEPAGAL